MVPKCRAALKHLDFMMIRPDPNEQQCDIGVEERYCNSSPALHGAYHPPRPRPPFPPVNNRIHWLHALLGRCNNFALKSMRGYWHDYQTADIEGSILWEADMAFNQGMCKWTQYINALSDATGCDPGSIIVHSSLRPLDPCAASAPRSRAIPPVSVRTPNRPPHRRRPCADDGRAAGLQGVRDRPLGGRWRRPVVAAEDRPRVRM